MNPAQKLYGRNAECQTLDRLMADVRAARGRAMIVRGEVGAGKRLALGVPAVQLLCRVHASSEPAGPGGTQWSDDDT
jgi:type II secretory pathway predicted ATPase ExeA